MIKLALSSLCCHYIDDVLALATSAPDKAIEWDLNYIPPSFSKLRVERIVSTIKNYELDIRYHLPYSFLEIAHVDQTSRHYSILTIKRYLDFISELNGRFAVLHVGYFDGSNDVIALQSLNEVAQYAKHLNISLCIENLIHGLTTKTLFLQKALEIDNIYLCLDTGHAQIVSTTQSDYFSELSKLLNKCVHAHVYLTEDRDYNHVSFANIQDLERNRFILPLFGSSCDWYTMELDNKALQEKQVNIILQYFKQNLDCC